MTQITDPSISAAPALASADRLYLRLNSPPSGQSPDRYLTVDALRGDMRENLVGARSQRNLLINSRFGINQRSFAGGALGAGVYGFDGWKAGTGGCTLSVSSGVATLSGPLVQIIEAPRIAGLTVTISAGDPSAALPVTIGDSGANLASGSIPVGSGRQSVQLTVPGAASGNVYFTVNPTSSTVFRDLQITAGIGDTFDWRSDEAELASCQRFYQAGQFEFGGYMTNAAVMPTTIQLQPNMRATPTVAAANDTITGDATLAAAQVDATGLKATLTKTVGDGICSAVFDWTADASL